jgi:large subunit ribosomal protein L17
MNHQVKGRKFKRDHAQRKALMKHLSESLILQGRIPTTTAKAKELAPYVAKLVTRAKIVHGMLADEPAMKLLGEIAKKFENQPGGYTRIIKVGTRNHDAAQMSIIEFI